MLGRVALMVGGATVAVLVSGGTLVPVAGAAIMGGAGLVVGGGTELANQVQSGEAINPGAIATRTAFGGVKGALWGLAPELGAVGFGASIGGYSAVENLTYNATKGKTAASDSIEAIAGGLGEGLFAGIMHKASSKVASKASESTPAKPEPIKPMTEAELEKVSGGAKDPGCKPGGTNAEPQGVGSPVKIADRGISNGRHEPNNLFEQMAMQQVKSDPLNGAVDLSIIPKPIVLKDARWPAGDGWVKMQRTITGLDGQKTIIHFVYNKVTKTFDDFKFL